MKTAATVLPFDPSPVKSGEAATAVCTTKLEGQPLFRWSKDGQEVRSSDRIGIINRGKVSFLTIDDSKQEDGGNYTCIATGGGSKFHKAHYQLIVQGS